MIESFDYLMAHLNEINKCEESDRDYALEHHLNNALKQMAQLAALKEEFAAFKLATAETAQFYIERIDSIKEENERLKVDAVNIRSQLSQVAKAMAWEPPYQASLVERAENLKESNDALKARVAELQEHEKIYIEVLRVADVALKTVRRKEPANEG